jgi:hypothetical protein
VSGRRHLLITAAFLLLLPAPDALAGRTLPTASFTARISGTYTTSGTVTNTRCYRVDENDNQIPFSASGNASESTSFRATRGALLGVSRTPGQRRIIAGGPAIPVTATMNRSSTLDSGTEPQGCKPNPPLQRSCGRKTKAFKLSVFGVRRGYGFSYNFSSGFSSTFPADPFECPLVEGEDWWGQYYSRGNGTAPASTVRLFNRRVRRIVVRGVLRKSPQRGSAAEGYSASSTESLSWTLTLVRRG